MSYFDPDLNKKVLIQDIEQVSQSTQKVRQKRETREKKEYDIASKEYEKDVKAAEAQYQKDVAEYNRQVAEAERLAKEQNRYDAEIARLEAQKQKELSDAHYSVWGPSGSRNRSELNQKQNTIVKNYDSKINKAIESKRVEAGYQEFSIAYPGQILPRNVAQTFRSSPSFSLTDAYQTKIESKAAKAEYQRQASAQTAQNIAAKQSVEYHSNIPNIGFISSYGLQEGSQRAGAIKSTPETYSTLLGGGKKAVETRARLTNVDTGQSIMGGQQASPEITIVRTETYRETPGGPVLVRNVERTIPERKESKGVPSFANPVAFVASLDRQNVDAAGVPIKEKVQKSNIEILKDTLSRYQALTGEQRAPYKSVLEASLTDKGRRIDPISKLFIEQSALKQYSTRAEVFGLTEAKGRKGIIKKDGKQIFDLETGLGDVTLGRKLGYVYDFNLQKPTEEKPVLFEGSLQYVLAPKVQGPQQPKLEEAKAFPGTLEYAVASEPKQTSFNKSLENQYNKLGELQEITAKKAKSGDPRDILVQIAYAPSEAVRSIIGAGGSIVNLFEQNIDPITEKQLNLKRTARPAPIIFQSDVAGTVVLPYQFEKGRFDVSFEEYAQRQTQFIEKKGLPAYVTGVGFDYIGLKGAPGLIKTSTRTAPKLLSKLAVPVGKKQLLAAKGGISIPAKTWDVTEKIGFRIVKPTKTKVPQIGKVTTQQPVPNPFGKERVVPYNLQKAQQRIVGGLQTAKVKAVQVGGKVKTAIKKDIAFPNRSLIEGKNIDIPNMTRPAKPEFSKTLESLRIGLDVKRASVAKRLSEMENIYRGGIDAPSPYSRRLESLGIGLRIKRQEFAKGISSIGKNIPELKTPKGIIKIQKGLEKRKKAIIFIGKRTIKGIETRRENIIKSLGKLKPTIKAPYLPQKTSLEIAKFKQKEKLDATLARMRKIATTEDKPKAVVPNLSKNFLSRLKRDGISEPWDFRSIVKPFQKLSLRKEFASGIRGSPIGKVKGTTSRKEFARLLTESDTAPIASPLTKAKRNLLPEGSYDLQKKILLGDIGKIRRKGIDILERKEKTVKGLRGSLKTPDTELEILKGDLSKIGIKASPKQFIPKYSIKDLPAKSPDYNFTKMLKDVGVIRRKASDYLSFRKMETGALRGTLKTPDTKFELAKQDILKIKSKSERIARLKTNIFEQSKQGKLKIKDYFITSKIPVEAGKTVFHGTSKESADIILKKGFRFKSRFNETEYVKGVFTGEKSKASVYATKKEGVVLKITLKKGIRIGTVPDLIKSIGKKEVTMKDIFKRAKQNRLDIVEGVGYNPFTGKDTIETIILNKKAVYKIEGSGSTFIDKTPLRDRTIKSLKTFKVDLPEKQITIFPVPRKPTELENILEGFKKEKKAGQPYKRVKIDKYVPKYPKSWEAWRGVGIVTAAGTISALGLGQEKAEALPFASIGKIGARQVESSGQVLLFKESKDFGKISRPILVPPTLKERQEEDEDNVLLARTTPRQVMTVLPKVSFEFSTPQRVQESIKMKTIQPAKISVVQSAPQKTRQREKQKVRQISTPKYETIAITRVTPKLKAAQTPKLASPLAPKAPTRLSAPQRQPLREKPRQISLLRQRPPRRPPRVIFALPPDKEKKTEKRKTEKSEIGFYLGNVPMDQISGMFRRKEITLGKEKIQKTITGDVRVLLGKKRETRRKKKDESILGFKVPKTKFF